MSKEFTVEDITEASLAAADEGREEPYVLPDDVARKLGLVE